MMIIHSFFLFLLLITPFCAKQLNSDIQPPKRLVSNFGNIRIGGLVPVHLRQSNETLCAIHDPRYSYIRSREGTEKCYKLYHVGIMWAEAIRFSVLAANKYFFNGTNITLGYDIRDSENNVDVALDAALDFTSLRRRPETCVRNNTRECACLANVTEPYVVSLIGGARSEVSQRVNAVVGVMSLPQISYSSTSVSLSDKTNYRTFLRTISPDNYQARVMADIVKSYGWTYVATVATNEDYGRRGVEGFHEEARKSNICISTQRLFHFDISSEDTKRKIKNIVSELKADKKTSVILLFCELHRAYAVLKEAEAQSMTGKTWIAAESWGVREPIFDFDISVVGGILGVVPPVTSLPLFEQYLANLNPNTSAHNPWLLEYFREQSCNVGDENCKINQSLNASILHRHKASYVMDAVYTVVLGLLTYMKCGAQDSADCLKNIDLEKLREYMLSVNVTGFSRRLLNYDKMGNPTGIYYKISNLQPDPKTKKGKKFVLVGSWSNGHLYINHPIYWNGGWSTAPVSICSFPCPPGHYHVIGDVSCCWKCVLCPAGKFKVGTGNRKCDSCPEGYISDSSHTRCVRIPEKFIRWDSATSVILFSLSFFGVLVTSFIFGVYFKYRKTPIVKAASRYPSLLLLVLIALMFALPFLYIGRPSLVRCHMQPIVLGLLMTLAISLVLTKTFLLIQIFNNIVANLRDKPLVTAKTQFLFVFAIVVIEIILILVFLDRRPIEVSTVVEDATIPIDCGSSAKALHTAVLLYNWLLAMICALMAFRARSLPANFSEARLISFAMFTFSVIWLSFLIVFSGSLISEYSTYMCVSILATALDLLVYMFAPKIFVICFRPELNETHVVRADIYRYTMKQLARSNTPNPESNESVHARAQLDGISPGSKSAQSFQESKL